MLDRRTVYLTTGVGTDSSSAMQPWIVAAAGTRFSARQSRQRLAAIMIELECDICGWRRGYFQQRVDPFDPHPELGRAKRHLRAARLKTARAEIDRCVLALLVLLQNEFRHRRIRKRSRWLKHVQRPYPLRADEMTLDDIGRERPQRIMVRVASGARHRTSPLYDSPSSKSWRTSVHRSASFQHLLIMKGFSTEKQL